MGIATDTASFLRKVTAEVPRPIKTSEIDGGSEFMAEFEKGRPHPNEYFKICRDRITRPSHFC